MTIPSDIRHSWDSITFGQGCEDCYYWEKMEEDQDDTFRLVRAVHRAACDLCLYGQEDCGNLEALEEEL